MGGNTVKSKARVMKSEVVAYSGLVNVVSWIRVERIEAEESSSALPGKNLVSAIGYRISVGFASRLGWPRGRCTRRIVRADQLARGLVVGTGHGESAWVVLIDRIATGVLIEIGRSSRKEDRVLRHPPSRNRIVVARPEPRQPRVQIPQPTRETKRLRPRRGVGEDVPELVPIDPLGDCARRGVHDEAYAAELVGDQPVRSGPLHHVLGNIRVEAVDERRFHRAGPVEPRRRLESVAVEEALG